MLKRFQVSRLPFTLTIAAFGTFALLASGPAANSQTATGSGKAESTFKTNCVMCHGADGAGTALGKRLQVPDLRSRKIQSQSTAALAQIISKGKANMPPFGGSLDAKQIDSLVRYIRHFRAGAPAGAK